jgi:UDP-N-acetylenolpyruvoylglucosamine reductase
MKSAREALTSPPLCFTTGFPGSPKGLLPQNLFNSSIAVHRSGTNNCCLEAKGKAEKLQTQASEFGDRKSEIDML